MGSFGKYNIRISHLQTGKNLYHFEVDSSFLDTFSQELLTGVKADVEVSVNKTSAMLEVVYRIKGELTLLCDRCSQPYKHPIQSQNHVFYSFNPVKISDEEIIVISSELDSLDLSQDIYDFLCLNIPVRKIPEDDISHRCPPEILDFLTEEPGELPQLFEEVDPRWEQLKDLKTKLN